MAAQQARSSLDGAWMVGDSPLNDTHGANELGVSTIQISRGRPWPPDTAPPTATVDELAEVSLAILDGVRFVGE